MQMLELHACMPEELGDRVGQHLMSVGAHRQSKCPCQPKVGQLERVVFPVNQQILGLQVPVQNSAAPQRTALETYRKNGTEKTITECSEVLLLDAVAARFSLTCVHGSM